MKQEHRIRISVANQRGDNTELLKSRNKKLRDKILTFLFGKYSEVFILEPGKTINSVEILETSMEKK